MTRRADHRSGTRAVHLGLIAGLLSVMPATAIDLPHLQGTARGFPALRDLDGRTLADGNFAQWLEGDRLHIRIVYAFRGNRRIEERAVFQQRPELVQDAWSWREERDGRLYREFEVDFPAKRARAQKHEADDLEQWTEEVDIQPGRTFAGFGFTLALKGLRERLVDGEEVELQAVAFRPQPQVVSVELAYGGRERMRMADRRITADRFVIRPNLPWLVGLFVDVPDTQIWMTLPPAEFVRWEGPLVEPDDPIMRVDVLPGGESGPAAPVG